MRCVDMHDAHRPVGLCSSTCICPTLSLPAPSERKMAGSALHSDHSMSI
jgi:hypothetical protein